MVEHVRMHFSSLPRILLSLVQFVTADSISGIYFPLIINKPALSIYFVLLIITVTLALMNLVNATLVEDAIEMARMDHEMEQVYKRRRINSVKPGLRELFRMIDVDNDGAMTMQEVVSALQDGLPIPAELQGILTEAHVLDLYEGLDSNGDGELTVEEFVEGLCNAAVSDVPMETVRIVQMLRTTMGQLSRMERALHNIEAEPSKRCRR